MVSGLQGRLPSPEYCPCTPAAHFLVTKNVPILLIAPSTASCLPFQCAGSTVLQFLEHMQALFLEEGVELLAQTGSDFSEFH